MTGDPLAQALALKESLAAQDDTRTMLPLLEPLLAALTAREGLLPWIVVADPATRSGFREDFEAGFDAFWSTYPVKVGKFKARQAAYKAVRRATWPGWDRAIAAVEAQKESPRWRGGTIPNPATWFNGDRWDDDPATMTAIGNGNGRAEDAPAYLPASIRQRWSVMSRQERSLVLENAAQGAYR